MACHLRNDDRPMTVQQMFTYIRHRYRDLHAYYLEGREIIAIPLSDDIGDVVLELRELAVRNDMTCNEVTAAWPELVGPELTSLDSAQNFLVIAQIRGKYLQPK